MRELWYVLYITLPTVFFCFYLLFCALPCSYSCFFNQGVCFQFLRLAEMVSKVRACRFGFLSDMQPSTDSLTRPIALLSKQFVLHSLGCHLLLGCPLIATAVLQAIHTVVLTAAGCSGGPRLQPVLPLYAKEPSSASVSCFTWDSPPRCASAGGYDGRL